MKYIFLILFTAFLIPRSYSCECPETSLNQLDSLSYSQYDLVIIGEVIKTGINYEIVVKEVFKGQTDSDTLKGTIYLNSEKEESSCTSIFHKNGNYLLYLDKKKINNKTYCYTDECNASRSLDTTVLPFVLDWQKPKGELLQYTNDWIEQLRLLK